MKFVKANINDWVRVKLTDFGKKVLLEHYNHVFNGTLVDSQKHYEKAIRQEVDGWTKWQMHELINIFGGTLSFSELPFEANYEIEVNDHAD